MFSKKLVVPARVLISTLLFPILKSEAQIFKTDTIVQKEKHW